MKKVSIIVPVYNTAPYIDNCMQSILSQSYKNFEILVVNDGSKDNSLEICRAWELRDNRIRLFNQNNNGVSYSRNFAIDQSTGEYLVFIDSDDIISPDYVESLVELIEQNKTDCAVVGISKFYSDQGILFTDGNIDFYEGENISKALFTKLGGFLANKIYKADIINEHHLRLNENIFMSEDLLFNARYFQYCKSVVFMSGAKYFYRIYGSSSFNDLANSRWFSIIDSYNSILSIYKDNMSVKNIILYNFMMILYEARYRANLIQPVDEELNQKINQLILLHADSIVSFGIKQKIKLLLFDYFPQLVMKYKRRKFKRI